MTVAADTARRIWIATWPRPPVPIVGYGTIEEEFRKLGTELAFGTITVDEAVERFFSQMDITLNG